MFALYRPIFAVKWKTHNLTHRRIFCENDDIYTGCGIIHATSRKNTGNEAQECIYNRQNHKVCSKWPPSAYTTSSHRFATAKQMRRSKLVLLWIIAHSSSISCHSIGRFGNQRRKTCSFKIPQMAKSNGVRSGDRDNQNPTVSDRETVVTIQHVLGGQSNWGKRDRETRALQLNNEVAHRLAANTMGLLFNSSRISSSKLRYFSSVTVSSKNYGPSRLRMVTPTHTVTPGTFSSSWSVMRGLSVAL